MSETEIIGKLMKQWQSDVNKYRQELNKYKNEQVENIKYKTELEEVKKELAELKDRSRKIEEENKILVGLPKVFPVDKKEIVAIEVFWDYTVLLSENDDKETIIFADLHIKNTGTVQLQHPLICIRMEPPAVAKLSGKILPPDAVEAMGVYTMEGGIEGWVFMNTGEEWLEAINRGEYWIQSIQPLVLPPGESQSINGFQLTIPRQKSGDRFIIHAFVYIDKKPYASTNKISIQFL